MYDCQHTADGSHTHPRLAMGYGEIQA